jgi:hypothetical protein
MAGSVWRGGGKIHNSINPSQTGMWTAIQQLAGCYGRSLRTIFTESLLLKDRPEFGYINGVAFEP